MVEYRIKSKFLTAITEMTKKLSLTEEGVTATSPAMDEEGNFITDIKTDKELQLQGVGVDVEKKEEPQTKEEMMSQAIEKFKNAADVISEFDELIKKIAQSGDEDPDSNTWILNDDGNDVFLQSRDAHIFQQNGNILLSHDGMIEIFKTVPELHDWLKKNNFPLPPAVEIHESTDEQILKILEG